jgi:hypothetical protein
MSQNFQAKGIILTKNLWRNQDLQCWLLLSNGMKSFQTFYGGKGGGSLSKGSSLELGFCLDLSWFPRKKLEFQLHYFHQNWRKHYGSIYLLTWMLACFKELAPEFNGHLEYTEFQFQYALLASLIFHGDLYLKDHSFNQTFQNTVLGIFLGKWLLQSGHDLPPVLLTSEHKGTYLALYQNKTPECLLNLHFQTEEIILTWNHFKKITSIEFLALPN